MLAALRVMVHSTSRHIASGIGTFLLKLHDGHQFLFAGNVALQALGIERRKPQLVLVVVSKNDFDTSMGPQGLQIDVLSFDYGWIVWKGLDVRGEVENSFNLMVLSQECTDKTGYIEPFEFRMAFKHAEVEIPGVNADVGFHGFEMLRPRLLRTEAPLRVGKTLRLDDGVMT